MFYFLITSICSPIIYLIIKIRSLLYKEKNRFLIIQTGKIGDMVYATSVISTLKKRVPQAWIAVLTSPISQALLRYNPHVNEILTFNQDKHNGLIGKFRLAYLIRINRISCSFNLKYGVPTIHWRLLLISPPLILKINSSSL